MPDWITTISEAKTQSMYKRGQYIIHEGEHVYGMYFIHEGKVKIVSTGINMREQIVRFADSNNNILGHRGYGAERYPISAVSLEDSEVCFVENNVLTEVFMVNPKFTFEMMMFYSRELRRSETRMKFLTQMTVRERIAEALFFVRDCMGLDPVDNSLNVSLSRQEIADLAGTNAEQVSRYFTEFKNENILDLDGKKIIIKNENLLREIIHDYENFV